MKVLVVGDTHGRVGDIIPKIHTAGYSKIKHVMVVGDFGLWTHFADGHHFLDEVEDAARANDLSVFAIGGNHENWDHWNWFVNNMPHHKGFAMVRRRILLAPKAHRWTWANKTFIGAGGAVSIDKDDRLRNERPIRDREGRIIQRGTGDRTLWWPNETLDDADMEKILSYGRADYLFSHDCSNHTPWKQQLIPDPDSVIHRQKIDEIVASVKPAFHFHGHMHSKYDWNNTRSHGYYSEDEDGAVSTRTIGLEAFTDYYSWGVLDVDKDEWQWPGEFLAEQGGTR